MWVILLVVGFGALTFYVVQRTMVMDSEGSLTVKRSLGVEAGIGLGKQNKSAVLAAKTHKANERLEAQGIKRSSKKTR